MSTESDNILNLRCRIGQRSGLVEYDSVCFRCCFKKFSAFDGNHILTCFSHRRENRYRHRKLERTREVNHQHCQSLRDVARQKIGQNRSAKRIRHQLICQSRGFIFRLGLQFFRFLNHLHNAVISARSARLFNANQTLSLFNRSSGINIATLLLSDRKGFACNRSLINRRFS